MYTDILITCLPVLILRSSSWVSFHIVNPVQQLSMAFQPLWIITHCIQRGLPVTYVEWKIFMMHLRGLEAQISKQPVAVQPQDCWEGKPKLQNCTSPFQQRADLWYRTDNTFLKKREALQNKSRPTLSTESIWLPSDQSPQHGLSHILRLWYLTQNTNLIQRRCH